MGARFLAVGLLATLFGCGETAKLQSGGPLVVPSAPEANIVAHLASFKSGVGAVAVVDGAKVTELFPSSSDVVLRASTTARTFFAIDRHHGAIYRHDLTTTQLLPPFYKDRGANFQDIHELPDGSAWVSALNRESIVRIDRAGKVVESVSLQELAADNPKRFAYPTYFWSSAGRTFLLLQCLKDGVRPSEKSWVVELAPGKGIVGEPHALAATNPYTDWVPAAPGCAYIGEAGETGAFSQLDGAIEQFCPAAEKPWSLVVTEKQLERDLYDFVVLPEDRLLLLSTSPKNDIFVFDRKRAALEAPIESVAGFRYVDLIGDGDGKVYVADRDETAPGIRAVDVAARKLLPVVRTALEPLSLLWMR